MRVLPRCTVVGESHARERPDKALHWLLLIGQVVKDGHDGNDEQHHRKWHDRDKPEALERNRAQKSAEKEESDQHRVNLQAFAVGANLVVGEMFGSAVPVEQLAELDADVGDEAGHVRGSDHGA